MKEDGRQSGERAIDELDRLPELWEATYGPGRGSLALFSGLRPVPAGKLAATREAYFAWPRETAAARRWIEQEAAADRDVYQCGHLVGRWRRRKTDALPLSSLYADLDNGLPADVDLRPSVLVESSPGHYQAYLRLSRTVPPAEGAALNQRLALALGGDPGGWDLTQLFRVPGTVNHKYESRPVVRVVELTGRTYDPDELGYQLPALADVRRGEQRAAAGPVPPVGSDPPIPLTRSALAVWHGENVRRTPAGVIDRSASLIRIARILHQAGLHREHLVAVLAERDASLGWEKYTGRNDAEEQYHRIVDVVERGRPTHRRPRGNGARWFPDGTT